jgi:molybdate transport system substrate-binding protein
MSRAALLVITILILAGLSASVVHRRSAQRSSNNVTLSLFCGAGLRPPVADAVEMFQRETAIKVECTYGASNLLLGQLKLHRKGDVFLPGDQFYVDQAQAENLVRESRPIAYFTPVIMVKKGNPLNIRGLHDLTKDGVRLGLADERSAAVGRVAHEIIKNSGVSLKAIERNVSFTSTTVHELGDSLKLGHVDAVIVWNAIARQYDKVADIVQIPSEHNLSVPIPAAMIKASTNREAARRFIDFLASERGQEIFRRHHYDVIPSEELK